MTPAIDPAALAASLNVLACALEERSLLGVEQALARVPWRAALAEIERRPALRGGAPLSPVEANISGFLTRVERSGQLATEHGAASVEEQSKELDALFAPFVCEPGALEALGEVFLLTAQDRDGLSRNPTPALVAFLGRAIHARRSPRAAHFLGLIAAQTRSLGKPCLEALARAVPGEAIGRVWRDQVLASLAEDLEVPDFGFSAEQKESFLGEQALLARATIQTLIRAGWADADDLALRLCASFWGDAAWRPGGQPELSVELALALRELAPARPEWPAWIDGAWQAAEAGEGRGLGERWAKPMIFFRRLAAEIERRALLGLDAAGAAATLQGETAARAPRL
jgi:hypothetical protein